MLFHPGENQGGTIGIWLWATIAFGLTPETVPCGHPELPALEADAARIESAIKDLPQSEQAEPDARYVERVVLTQSVTWLDVNPTTHPRGPLKRCARHGSETVLGAYINLPTRTFGVHINRKTVTRHGNIVIVREHVVYWGDVTSLERPVVTYYERAE